MEMVWMFCYDTTNTLPHGYDEREEAGLSGALNPSINHHSRLIISQLICQSTCTRHIPQDQQKEDVNFLCHMEPNKLLIGQSKYNAMYIKHSVTPCEFKQDLWPINRKC